MTIDDANDVKNDLGTGTIGTGAGARTETRGTRTVIETGSHRGADIVAEVGMGNGTTNGATFDSVPPLCLFD